MAQRTLIPLGEGVYTVSEVCRILQPTMTRRKVHYWFDTGLLSPAPVNRHGRGLATLLSFRQLLEVRTAQRMRDDMRLPLPRVRQAFGWVLESVFAPTVSEVVFERGPNGSVIVKRDGDDLWIEIPSGQMAFNIDFEDLNQTLQSTRAAWDAKSFAIPSRPRLVANAKVLGGAPTVQGTRIETSLIAAFVADDRSVRQTVKEVLETYPHLDEAAVREALAFEGVTGAA